MLKVIAILICTTLCSYANDLPKPNLKDYNCVEVYGGYKCEKDGDKNYTYEKKVNPNGGGYTSTRIGEYSGIPSPYGSYIDENWYKYKTPTITIEDRRK